jgi:hypothetical protein
MARVDFRIPLSGARVGTKVVLDSQSTDIGAVSGDIFNQQGALKFHNGTATKTVAFTDSNITGSAAKWTTARTITLGGDLTGSVNIDGSENVTLTATIAENSVALGTDTTGNYIATIAGTTNQVSVSGSGSETAAVTLSLPQDIHSGASPTFTGMTLSGDLAVNGADITTTTTGTATLFNTNATTLSVGGAATTVSIGAGTGTTTVNNNLTISGNLTVNGTTVTVNSTVTTLDDPVITLGGDTAPESDDNKDRGVEFRWYDSEGATPGAKTGFFGFDDSSGKFTFIPDATNSSEVFSGTKGTIDVGSVEASTLFVDSIELDTTGATTSQVLQFNGTKFAPATLSQASAFTTIAVAGQDNVVADTASDTLTLAAGTGVTVTTNATTDTVTVGIGQSVATTDTVTFAAVNVSDGTLSVLEDFDSYTLTSDAAAGLKSVSATTYRSVKYVIQATEGTNYMVTEILAVHNGTNVSYTEYGTVIVGETPASFDVDINNGNVRLTATGGSALSTTYRVRTTAIPA